MMRKQNSTFKTAFLSEVGSIMIILLLWNWKNMPVMFWRMG